MMESREHLFQQKKWVTVVKEERQTETSWSLSAKATHDENPAFSEINIPARQLSNRFTELGLTAKQILT